MKSSVEKSVLFYQRNSYSARVMPTNKDVLENPFPKREILQTAQVVFAA
jgi:hypothetical protein